MALADGARVVIAVAIRDAALAAKPPLDLGPGPTPGGIARQQPHEQFTPFLRQIVRHAQAAGHKVEQERAFMHALEPTTLREHLQHDYAKAPPIRSRRAGAGNRFRRSVARRLARHGELKVELADGRGAEVREDEIERLTRANQHVRRLQIPVNNLHLRKAMERATDFAHGGVRKFGRRLLLRRDRAKRAEWQVFPHFKCSILGASCIQQAQAVIGIESAESGIKRCLWLDSAAVMFEDRGLVNPNGIRRFFGGEKQIRLAGNYSEFRSQCPAVDHAWGRLFAGRIGPLYRR